MMNDADNMNDVGSDKIENPMLAVHNAAQASSQVWFFDPCQRVAAQKIKRLVEPARISICRVLAELIGAIFIDFCQISFRRQAKFSPNHAGRDAQQ